jgi:hypothetical protein
VEDLMTTDALTDLLAQRLDAETVDPYCPMGAADVVRALAKEESHGFSGEELALLGGIQRAFWSRPQQRELFRESPPRFVGMVAGEDFPPAVWEALVALSAKLTHPVLGAFLDDQILTNKEGKGPVASVPGFDFRSHYQRTIRRYVNKVLWLRGQSPEKAHDFADLALSDAMERGAELCARYGELELARELLVPIREEAAKQSELQQWRWLLPPVQAFSVIAGSRKLTNLVDDNERRTFRDYARACAGGFAASGQLFHLIPDGNALARLLGEQLGEKDAEEQELRSNLRQIEKVAEGKAAESRIAGAAILDQALVLAKQLHDEAEVRRLTEKQVRYRREALANGEMKESHDTFEMKLEHWEAFLTPFVEQKTPEDALLLWIQHPSFVPDYMYIKASADRADSGLLEIFSTNVWGGIGLQVAAPGAERTSRELKIAVDVSRTAQLLAGMFLEPSWRFIVEQKGVQPAHVKARIEGWKLLHEANREIVLHGVERHFAGDYVSAIHILTPQFEALIRRAFLLAGSGEAIETIYSKAEGIEQQERTFGSFLSKDEVKEALGDKLAMHFRFLFTNDPGEKLLGLNLRNDVAHGLISPGALTPITSCVVLHAVLLLTMLIKKETPS